MSAEERTIARTLAQAIQVLPDGKREYLIGFAEGVAAMAEATRERTRGEAEPASKAGTRESPGIPGARKGGTH